MGVRAIRERRGLALLPAAVCCLWAISSRAQVEIPDTPAGQTLGAWLEAFNSGDRDRLQAYLETHRPERPVEPALAFRAQTGGFDLLSIERSEPFTIAFIVKERASDRRGFGRLDVADADPPRVTEMTLRVIPPGGTISGFAIDGATREAVIGGAVEKLRELYVFPDAAEAMAEALRERQRRGEYAEVTDGAQFARLLTEHLREVSHDLHLRVDFSPVAMPERPPEPTPEMREQNRRRMLQMNCGFEKVEHLSGNVGYLKLNVFADPEVCGPTATAAMGFLQHVDALIVDLRDNGGGSPHMVAHVSSNLFDEPTHLNDLWTRSTDETEEFWTSDVPGARLADQPVYVLTSARTFSGAEEFTYNLKSLGRATIVGETTGGGAHPTRGERLTDRFMIGVPFARAINPITKTNWEGTGVEPDVEVPADEALETARALAVEALGSRTPR